MGKKQTIYSWVGYGTFIESGLEKITMFYQDALLFGYPHELVNASDSQSTLCLTSIDMVGADLLASSSRRMESHAHNQGNYPAPIYDKLPYAGHIIIWKDGYVKRNVNKVPTTTNKSLLIFFHQLWCDFHSSFLFQHKYLA